MVLVVLVHLSSSEINNVNNGCKQRAGVFKPEGRYCHDTIRLNLINKSVNQNQLLSSNYM